MILYVIRHAWAEEADEARWPDDRRRPLTKAGRKRFTAVVETLAERGFAPELVVSSPLVRCLETAQLVAQGLRDSPRVVPCEELAPGSDWPALVEWMRREAGREEQVAWVGHAPDVGHLVAALVGDQAAAIDFSKGAVAAIAFDTQLAPAAGVLRWLVTAKLLGC
jgi:phosphohistidine phosphatase